MTQHDELGGALRDALPVFEAPPALKAWALEQAREADRSASAPGRSVGNSMRRAQHMRWIRPAQIAAMLMIGVAIGWGGARLNMSRPREADGARTAAAVVDDSLDLCCRPPYRCAVNRPSYREAVVCRKGRRRATCERPLGGRLPALRWPPGLHRGSQRGGNRVPPSAARDQSLCLAGFTGRASRRNFLREGLRGAALDYRRSELLGGVRCSSRRGRSVQDCLPPFEVTIDRYRFYIRPLATETQSHRAGDSSRLDKRHRRNCKFVCFFSLNCNCGRALRLDGRLRLPFRCSPRRKDLQSSRCRSSR